MSNQNRHPAGTSAGGQWAPGSAAEVEADIFDAFDESIDETQPVSGELDLDDWDVRPQVDGVRTQREPFGLAGFVHPETMHDFDAMAYSIHTRGEDAEETISKHKDGLAPASSNAEIKHALDEYWELAHDTSIPLDETRRPLRELMLRDQSRRGLQLRETPDLSGSVNLGSGEGYMSRYIGGRYDGNMSTKEVAKEIRGEVKAAVKSGWLSDQFTYSVRTDHFSGGSAIRFTATAKEDKDEFYVEDDDGTGFVRRHHHPEVKELQRRMSAIADSYRYDYTDHYTDLFNTNFYCTPAVHKS